MPKRILVAGEALVDLVADDGALRPIPGGGPFNTACALGRLGVPVAFLGRLSSDRFGQLLEERLAASGVDLDYALRGPEPTPLAVVHAGADGDAEYVFYLRGTAHAALARGELPPLGDDVAALHVGTLALATDPPAAALAALVEHESERRLVVLDPNVRPAVAGDREEYRRRLLRLAGLAHVVKLSAADAAFLYPGADADAVAERLLAVGAALVVVTLGADGALARTAAASAEAAAPPVDVVDTLGAGDAFGAGLVCRLWERQRLTPTAVATLDESELADALAFAAAQGALQCARAGGAQ